MNTAVCECMNTVMWEYFLFEQHYIECHYYVNVSMCDFTLCEYYVSVLLLDYAMHKVAAVTEGYV